MAGSGFMTGKFEREPTAEPLVSTQVDSEVIDFDALSEETGSDELPETIDVVDTSQPDAVPDAEPEASSGLVSFLALEQKRLGTAATPDALERAAQRYLNAQYGGSSTEAAQPTQPAPQAASPYAGVEAEIARLNTASIEANMNIQALSQEPQSEEVRNLLKQQYSELATIQGAIAYQSGVKAQIDGRVQGQTFEAAQRGLREDFQSILATDFGFQKVTTDPYAQLPEGFKSPEMANVLATMPDIRRLVAQAMAYQELTTRRKAAPRAPRGDIQQPNQPAARAAPRANVVIGLDTIFGRKK